MALARSTSPSAETRSTISSATPLSFRSWRIFAAPYLRERERARSSAKRSSESCFLDSRRTTTAFSASSDSACGASLRTSSARECSRLTRSRSARAFSSAGVSGVSFNRSALRAGLSALVTAFPGRKALHLLVFHFLFLGGGGGRGLLHAGLLADLALDFLRQRRVLLQEVARVVLALAEAVAVVDVPGARLFQH